MRTGFFVHLFFFVVVVVVVHFLFFFSFTRQVPPDFPTIDEICSAPWTTTRFIPPELRDAWPAIFVEQLRNFVRRPCRATLAMLFLTTRALMVCLRRGGKSRGEVVRCVLRACINAWKAGKIPSIWQRLVKENRLRCPQQRPQSPFTAAPARFEHVAQLVDSAAQLCLRGLADDTDDKYEKIQRLFPQSAMGIIVPAPEAAPTDVEHAVVRKSTLSGAAISRAATALARLTLINNPAGMRLDLLQLQTSRQPASSFCGSIRQRQQPLRSMRAATTKHGHHHFA